MHDVSRVLWAFAPTAKEVELRKKGFSPSQAVWLVHLQLLFRNGVFAEDGGPRRYRTFARQR